MAALRLAVISHSGVLEVNRAVYTALAAAHPELELRLIVPERWHAEVAGNQWYVAKPGTLVRPLPVHGPGRLHLHYYGRGLAQLLADFRPAVILVDEEPYSVAALQAARLARRGGARLVVYTKQNLVRHYPPPFSWIRTHVLREASHMLALTEECAEVLRAIGYQGTISLLPHAFSLPDEVPGAGETTRADLGLAGPVVGCVGRLEALKGLLDLLEAARLLREQGQSPRLLLVGDGPLREELVQRAARDLAPGQLKLAGYVPHDQVGAYFQALDVMVLASRTTPSWKEQFGRVLLEAWGYGVPVVGSDSGHIPELIRQTGGGLIFREGDAADLAEKLGQLLADPARARSMAQSAREVVRREYSLERVAEQVWEAVSS